MFAWLGRACVRFWPVFLVFWVVAAIVVSIIAPPLHQVATTVEFGFLPRNYPSLVAERVFAEAFPDDPVRSRFVVIARRESGLEQRDRDFIDDGHDGQEETDPLYELKDRLLKIVDESGGFASKADAEKVVSVFGGGDKDRPVVWDVDTYRNGRFGKLLSSEDGKATLVLIGVTSEFLDMAHAQVAQRIEQLIYFDKDFRSHIPPGLELALSGDAAVGRAMAIATRDSAKATESLTVILVVILLIAIYRSPLLAFLPLFSVFLAVTVTMKLLILMGSMGWITLFSGIETYVTVLVYGAGVDYCLFLIARYKEEVDRGATLEDAVELSVTRVGAAISTSAGTSIGGIGMMMFAEFGKFREAGFAIAFGLLVVLIACLTLTPALLRLFGKWTFWPNIPQERISSETGWIPHASILTELSPTDWLNRLWEKVGAVIQICPARILLGTMGAMLPFVIIAILLIDFLSYGLMSDLPDSTLSVQGAKAVNEHFPPGTSGPINVLIRNRRVDFTTRVGQDSGVELIGELTDRINAEKSRLMIADIRSLSHPIGGDDDVRKIAALVRRKKSMDEAVKKYVSATGVDATHLTQMDITAELDPFSRDSIEHINRLQKDLVKMLPAGLKEGTEILVRGSTASIRDLKTVTDHDQIRIDLLVMGTVFIILIILLRQVSISFYLLFTVLFSYLATLGVTFTIFWLLDPHGFSGLDWKVPMFLFTILIAVGEDYNIFLMARIQEEQDLLGPIPGIIEALARTGRIISSCGIIMAGTFMSLMAASLQAMIQLGFALAFGVLLDTFIVRPILVPAYLVMLNQGRFGRFGYWLGQHPASIQAAANIKSGVSPEMNGVAIESSPPATE